jgi:hypothetical protein
MVLSKTKMTNDNYDELVELARLCWRQSYLAQNEDVAREFRKMAREYQEAAAKLDDGELPALEGDEPN